MPWPIRPAPATKTRSMLIAVSSACRGRPAGGPRPRRDRARGAATASMRRVGRGRRAPGERQAVPEPLHEDGAHLRGGPRRGGRPAWPPRPTPRRGGGRGRRAAPGRPRRSIAVVTRTSGRLGSGRSGSRGRPRAAGGTSIARSWAAVRWAPGRSPLLTTTMSATSSRPALIAWTSSPISGASSTTVVSAAAATSTSLWPVPTVSSRTMSKPAASSTAAAAVDVAASPPACPREAIERMKTPSSAAYDCMRTRSPRSAPPVIGEDGSTATTATVRPAARAARAISAATSVDLPAPGGPVIPTRCAPPASGYRRRRRVLGDRRVVLDRGQEPGERPAVAGCGRRRRGPRRARRACRP